MTRVLICGGRDFDDIDMMQDVLWNHVYPGDTLIHGDCRGADKLSEKLAQPDTKIERYPADWTKWGRDAGFMRNVQMLEVGKPDIVVALPGGKGTAMMVRLAKKAGIKVTEI